MRSWHAPFIIAINALDLPRLLVRSGWLIYVSDLHIGLRHHILPSNITKFTLLRPRFHRATAHADDDTRALPLSAPATSDPTSPLPGLQRSDRSRPAFSCL